MMFTIDVLEADISGSPGTLMLTLQVTVKTPVPLRPTVRLLLLFIPRGLVVVVEMKLVVKSKSLVQKKFLSTSRVVGTVAKHVKTASFKGGLSGKRTNEGVRATDKVGSEKGKRTRSS